jgi:hypothetical protein
MVKNLPLRGVSTILMLVIFLLKQLVTNKKGNI